MRASQADPADTLRESPRHGEVFETRRLEAFADGVLAIAITLLVLGIQLPGQTGDLVSALAVRWPSYVAYVTSFLTIGIIWINHHQLFTLIDRTTRTFLMINVVFLMTVAFLPYPTAIVAQRLATGSDDAAAAVFYGLTMVAIAVMFNVVWEYASRDGRLLGAWVERASLRRGTRSYRAGPVAYLACSVVAIWLPLLGVLLFGALAVFWALPVSSPAN